MPFIISDRMNLKVPKRWRPLPGLPHRIELVRSKCYFHCLQVSNIVSHVYLALQLLQAKFLPVKFEDKNFVHDKLTMKTMKIKSLESLYICMRYTYTHIAKSFCYHQINMKNKTNIVAQGPFTKLYTYICIYLCSMHLCILHTLTY